MNLSGNAILQNLSRKIKFLFEAAMVTLNQATFACRRESTDVESVHRRLVFALGTDGDEIDYFSGRIMPLPVDCQDTVTRIAYL